MLLRDLNVRLTFLGGATRTSGPCGKRKEGPQGRKGSVTSLHERRTIISPLVLLSLVSALMLVSLCQAPQKSYDYVLVGHKDEEAEGDKETQRTIKQKAFIEMLRKKNIKVLVSSQ